MNEVRSNDFLGKEKAYWRILEGALELDFHKGHLRWTMAELARKTRVTRSLIYYHFGKSKLELLKAAVRVVGEDVIGTSEQRMQLWFNGQWVESIQRARMTAERVPVLCGFYLMHRERNSEIGDSIRQKEGLYIRKLRKLFPNHQEATLRALFASFFGLIFSPHVDTETIERAVIGIKKVMS